MSTPAAEPEPSRFASYAAETHQARSRLRRFSHAARFQLATELAAPASGATLLDYGCGDGAYLARLAEVRPDLKLIAWHPFVAEQEPLREHLAAHPGIQVPARIDDVESGSIDVVTVLEVFEHLPQRVFELEMDRIERILAPGGRLAVTVPIEVGPGSFGKNLARIATRTVHGGTSAGTMLRAAAGRSVKRPDDDYILSHVGFDHRKFLAMLQARGWEVEQRMTSPLPLVGATLNSQIGWRLKRGQA